MSREQTGSSSPMDWSSLLDSMGGDIEILEEIVRLFLEFGPTQVADLDEAIGAEMSEEMPLHSLAHGLKGSLAQFQREAATSMAAELEQFGRDGDLAAARELWPSLLREVQDLLACLETWLEARAG